MNIIENSKIMTKDKAQRMNGMGNGMHTAHQGERATGQTAKPEKSGAGQRIAQGLRSGLMTALLLTCATAWAATVPDAPTIGTATITGYHQASVSFTPPAANGGSPITRYTAKSAIGSLTGTCTASPCSVTGLAYGTAYTFKVTATNAAGTSAASAASNSVTQAAPVLPTVALTSPAANTVTTAPGSFTLTATATSTASTIAKVEFYASNSAGPAGSGWLIGAVTTAPYTYTWSNVAAGNYNLIAKAIDALGTANYSAAVNVTANTPPTINLTSPTNGTTVTAPGSYTLTATATSTTATVSKVDFYANDGTTNTLIGTATAEPYTVTWSNVALGSYSLTAVATDTLNATTTSTPVSVKVNTGVAQAYYIHSDHLDSPRVITDSQGNKVWQWDNQDPFGANMPNENPSGQGQFTCNLRHPGQYFDIETGLFYNINRHYDPVSGRYVESDPIGLAGGINTYTYVNGNPLSYVDAEGLVADKLILGGGMLLTGGAILNSMGRSSALKGKLEGLRDKTCKNKDDPCPEIQNEIQTTIQELAEKQLAMRVDRDKLFTVAYDKPNPSFANGNTRTWKGHQDDYNRLRGRLNNLIELAKYYECEVPPEAIIWANTLPPRTPDLMR